MASKRVLEALAEGQDQVETNDLKAYLITYLDETSTVVVAKVAPGLRGLVSKNTTDEGVLKPCFWQTKVPWFQEIRADLVKSIEALSSADVKQILAEMESVEE